MSEVERHCSRCGAILPVDEEVICPGCGFAYGDKTVAIEVSPDELLAEIARQKGGVEPREPSQVEMSVSGLLELEASQDAPQSAPGGQMRLVAALVALVALILVAVTLLAQLLGG